MKGIFTFVKTTIVGGLVFLVPVVVLVIVIGKALQLSMKAAEPMARFIPVESVAGVALANIVGLIIIGLVCFLAGLVARTSLASKAVREAETRVLWQIPGYAFVKGITDSFSANEEMATLHPVLARLDDAWQVAFEVERMPDGKVIVYLPGAPDPWSGSILLITEERIEPLKAPMMAVMGNLRRLGRGGSKLLSTQA
ncbi:MAG: DUF502 domain-containing protein [Candidatus Binatia bacterium]